MRSKREFCTRSASRKTGKASAVAFAEAEAEQKRSLPLNAARDDPEPAEGSTGASDGVGGPAGEAPGLVLKRPAARTALRIPTRLRPLTRDARLLFVTRFIRLFAYGSLSVVLVFYLVGIGLSAAQTGTLLTLTLVGDTFVSLFLTTRADRFGRRRTLVIGAVLMAGAGLAFASTNRLWLLFLAGTVGVISPSGHEVGPFLSIEQAALSHVVNDRSRTDVFAWYTMTGALATALGALAAGAATRVFHGAVASDVTPYRLVVIAYAALGGILAVLFSLLSGAAEPIAFAEKKAHRATFAGLSGLHQSSGVVAKLSALFALDSFGGGFVVQGFAAYWFYLAVRRGSRSTRGDLLLGEHLCRHFSAGRIQAGIPDWLGPDDGRHAPAVEHSADPGPADADAAARGSHAVAAVQHQSDGRPHPAVIRDGRRTARGTISGSRRHRRCSNNRRGGQSRLCWTSIRQAGPDQHAVLHCRRSEDRLRPLVVPRVCRHPTTGGSSSAGTRAALKGDLCRDDREGTLTMGKKKRLQAVPWPGWTLPGPSTRPIFSRAAASGASTSHMMKM